MRLYRRIDFVKLPEKTIYSRVNGCNLFDGLFCKITGIDYGNDWVEQNLISETGFPEGIKDGFESVQYFENLRDTFKEFKTDLNCAGRDGCFDDEDVFVVWDNDDVKKLADYLLDCIK